VGLLPQVFPLQHPLGHDVVLHVHEPFTHVVPAPHGTPQPPQLALSDCSSTHALPQRRYGVLQLIPHVVPLHVAMP